MKYLNKYKQFNEGLKTPDNFIELRSLEYVLNPQIGEIYPTLAGGNYDVDNGHAVGDDYREYIDISDEDIEKMNEEMSQEAAAQAEANAAAAAKEQQANANTSQQTSANDINQAFSTEITK